MTRNRKSTRKPAPTTRLGGEIRLFANGVQVDVEQLERVIAQAGWRVTPAGAAYLAGLRDGQRGEVA